MKRKLLNELYMKKTLLAITTSFVLSVVALADSCPYQGPGPGGWSGWHNVGNPPTARWQDYTCRSCVDLSGGENPSRTFCDVKRQSPTLISQLWNPGSATWLTVYEDDDDCADTIAASCS